MAIGTGERGGERRDPSGRRAALELLVGGSTRHAESRRRGRATQLGGQQAGMTPADLGQRAARREARGDRHAQEVEHVGELARHHRRAAPRSLPQPDVGRQEARRRRSDQQQDAGPPGRTGQQREADRQPGERRAGLDGHDVISRRLEAGGGDAVVEPARCATREATAEPREHRHPGSATRQPDREHEVEQAGRRERTRHRGKHRRAGHRARTGRAAARTVERVIGLARAAPPRGSPRVGARRPCRPAIRRAGDRATPRACPGSPARPVRPRRAAG